MALTKTTAADRARRQASRAGSAPADALTDGIPSNNAAESDSAPMNAPSAQGAVAAPAPSPLVAPAAESAPAATGAPAPLTTAAPAAAPAPANVTMPAAASTAAETPAALVPAPLVSDIITPTAIAAPAPVPLQPPTPPSPQPRTPFPGNETMAPVLHAEKRKGKGKAKANEKGASHARHDKDEANLCRGIAWSLGFPTDMDNSASSSRQTGTISSTILAHAPPASPPRHPATAAPVTEPEARRCRADDNGCAIPVPGADCPDYGTIDGNPPRGSYMPTPPHGHRTIMGMTSQTLFRNHPVQQRRQWDAAPHPKFLGWISGGNGNRLQVAPRLQKHIADRFNMDPTDIHVGAPGPGEGPGPDPIAWIISIPQEQADYLLDIGALNSDDGLLTFYVPYNNPISPFLCTFTGFTIPEADAALALAIIGGAIADDPAVARFVRGHRDVFPAHLTADEAFVHFTESSDGTYIAWNIYAHSPMHNEEAFISLQSLLGNLSIFTVWSGTGVVLRRPLYCHLCRSVDHPTNICPVADLPGFMGPTAETIGALEQASHDALLQGRPDKNNQGGNNKGAKGAKGKGKDHEDRKGGNGRK
ncbi:hypothetical protein B0H17DRAFT_1141146 [Mycena rosella]|uniref:Uncharacterized protein n=1 Tax=Mycena rosella TaxID=1033263 RepID=A0AAD7D0A4_MYCRO|nr:hypothetical protein B0H17DRAFT_1141146 [Mycena rosella]